MVAEPQLPGQTVGVHDVELHVVLRDVALDVGRQLLLQLRLRPGGVQQEGAAVLDLVDHVVAVDVGLAVAGQEVRGADQVGGADRAAGETQVALGDAVGFSRVIFKVGLRVHPGVVADDLGGVLVRAHGAVGAEAPELAGHGVRALGDQRFVHVEGQLRHVVDDADSEEGLRLVGLHVVEHGLELGGGHVLGSQAVAAAVDHRRAGAVGKGGADVQIHGSGNGAGLLAAVHGRDLLDGLRQLGEEELNVEGAEQVDLQQADLLALGAQQVHDLTGGLAGGAHHDDDALGLLIAVVVEQMVVAAGDFVDPLHVGLHDRRDLQVVRVVGLLGLVVDVGALHGGALHRVLRVHGDAVEFLQRVLIQQLLHLLEVDHLDLLDLVGGAEAVEEVHEGHAGLDGGQVGDGGQVHDLLHASGTHHGDAGGAAAHHVLMVAEDVVGVLGDAAGGHVEDGGHAVSGHDVKVGDHQEQALGRRESSRHGAGLSHAVEGACRAALGLHLDKGDALAEHVLAAGGGPLVNLFAHGGRRRDGEDAGNVREMIGYGRAGLIAVHGFHDLLLSHGVPPVYLILYFCRSSARNGCRRGAGE